MRLRFDEQKATEAAARLLAARGGTMHYMKLLKLLYIADRRAILSMGSPITMDYYKAMHYGPVLDNVYRLIEDHRPEDGPIWTSVVSAPRDYQVSLKTQDIPRAALSFAEERILDQVFADYGHWDRWKLVDHLHEIFPEWEDPGNSWTPIRIADILRAENFSEEEIIALTSELEEMSESSWLLRTA